MALSQVANKLAHFYQKVEVEKLNQERFYLKAKLEEKIDKIKTAIIPLEQEENPSEKEKQCVADIKQGMDRLLELANKLEEKFSIFVVGDGNVGKSTVVNTLLGQEVAKMKFDPMTWKVDVFHEEDQKGVQVVTYNIKGNKTSYLSLEDAKVLLDEEEAKRDESICKIQENIRERTDMVQKACKAQNIPYREVVDKIEAYKERVWREELYTSPIVETKWPVRTNEVLKNFQIVDTPGLRQNRLSSYLQDAIKQYYEVADGIIWVMDINKIATNSTKSYIEEIEETLFDGRKARDHKRIIAILNRSDCIRTKEEKEVALEKAQELYGETFDEMIPFSATMALQGRLEGNQKLLQESGYEDLTRCIGDYFLLGANQVKIQKLLKEIQREEIKLQVVISYYVQEMEERLREHLARNRELTERFQKLEEEALSLVNDLNISYEHTVQAHIEKFTEALIETKADKVLLLKEDILNITRHQDEVKELLKGVLKQLEHIQTEYMDKEAMIQIEVHPLKTAIANLDIMRYFDFLEWDLGLEKTEEGPMRKLLSSIGMMKKMVDKSYIEQCKENIEEGLKESVATMNSELQDRVKMSLLQERGQILEIKQKQYDAIYGDDKKRVNQLYALKTVEKLLSEPLKESTIVDYIKGMGEI